MCGRFTLRSSGKAIAEVFGLTEPPHIQPHFNIAPSQSVAVNFGPSCHSAYFQLG